MIILQALSKVLEERTLQPLLENGINAEYFVDYEDEARFIFSHFKEYDEVPTKETFISKFDDIELIETFDNWEYLIKQLQEEYILSLGSIAINESVGRIEQSPFIGLQELKNNLDGILDIKKIEVTDLVKDFEKRKKEFKEKQEGKGNPISTGFKELDNAIFGFDRGDELVTIMGRPAQGKTWIGIKFLESAWKEGLRVGIYSGEMSSNKMGYRFDTLSSHIANLGLMHGSPLVEEQYEKYLEGLEKKENPFIVLTPKDLGRRANVDDIEQLIRQYNLDMIGIDQLSLIDDVRAKRGEPRRIELAHITDDLYNLSNKYDIPVLALNQANRMAGKENAPELEHASESDAIVQNSTKIITINHSDENILELHVAKARYGQTGISLLYHWDINTGKFTFIGNKSEDNEESTMNEEVRSRFKDSRRSF